MKTNNKVICNIAWLPTLFIIVFIFLLSSQDGQASYYSSAAFAGHVTGQSEVTDGLNTIFRTAAHFSEYACLSLSIGLAVTVNGFRGKIRSIYMIMIGAAVAFADEFFQIFIPDRYGDWLDIICDCFGVAVMAVLLYILTYGRYKKKLDYDSDKHRRMFGICIDNISMDEAISRIIQMSEVHDKKYVVTPNVDHVIINLRNETFRKVYSEASLVLTDGAPLMWIAESLGHPIKEKISGSDLFPAVCERASAEKKTVFLLGAGEGVAQKAAANLKKRIAGLKIAGIYSPKPGFEKDVNEIEKIKAIINKAHPDILVVGLGSPKQECFIWKHRKDMDFGVALPFGAAIDFEAGEVYRAPKWVRKIGLEWFFRFIQEPGRLFHRYFVDDMKIFFLAYKYRNEIRMQKLPEK